CLHSWYYMYTNGWIFGFSFISIRHQGWIYSYWRNQSPSEGLNPLVKGVID
ncbi:hypothetical protein SO802_007662, partial [Lithocarpus litseifolius]